MKKAIVLICRKKNIVLWLCFLLVFSGSYAQTTINIVSNKGVIVPMTINPEANTGMMRDANGNLKANNFINSFSTSVSSTTPMVLSITSAQNLEFTGSVAQTVTLPNATQLVAGFSFNIINNSSATITVNSHVGGFVFSIPSLNKAVLFLLKTENTANAWTAHLSSTTADLTGEVTSVGNLTTVTNAAVIAKLLTGYTSGAGTVAATDNILQAIQKLNGNDALKANLASPSFTGTPSLPTGTVAVTQTANNNTTAVATTAYADAQATAAVFGKQNTLNNSAGLAGALSDETGTGLAVFATSPTLVTPNLGTPSALVGTNISGTAAALNIGGNAATATLASTVTTNANLTGEVTSVGNAATVTNAAVISKLLTGYTSGAGTVAATDNILQAIQKLNGNDGLKAPLASPTFTGTPSLPTGTVAVTQTANNNTTAVATTAYVDNAASVAVTGKQNTLTNSAGLAGALSDETGTGLAVFATSPTLVTPNLGTPSALVGTNISGTAAGLTAGNVTTNANLTGEVTSVGNAATVTNAAVIAKLLTGYTSGAGTVAATDNILQAIQKLNGNDALKANLASPTFTGAPSLPTGTVAVTQTANNNTTAVATTAYVDAAAAAAGTVDATNAVKGKIQLAGDLAGTAALPTIAASAITSSKILDGTIVTADLADNSISTAKIIDGTIVAGDLAANAVTTAKITDANVTMAKLAQSGATTNQVLTWNGTAWAPATAPGGASYTAGSLITINSGVIAVDINGAIGAGGGDVEGSLNQLQLKIGAVEGFQIADGTIQTTKIADNTVTTAKIADGSISAAKLASASVTDNAIGYATINPNKLAQTGATNNQVLIWNGGGWVPGNVPSSTPTDASTTVKGVVQLAGDLAGTAAAPTITNAAVIGKVLTGYTSGAGTVAATDNILQAIQKLNGNIAGKQNTLTNSAGLAGALIDETGTGLAVFATSPTLVTPNLGTPSALVGTNITGTATEFTAGTATNLEAGSGGTIPYQSAAGTTAMLANGTTGQVLRSNGGTAEPSWVDAGVNYPAAPPSAGGSVTLTAADVIDEGIYMINNSATVTFPTAASLVAALSHPKVGDIVRFIIIPTGNNTPTIAVSTGGTIGSVASQGLARASRNLIIRITNVTTPAYTIY